MANYLLERINIRTFEPLYYDVVFHALFSVVPSYELGRGGNGQWPPSGEFRVTLGYSYDSVLPFVVPDFFFNVSEGPW